MQLVALALWPTLYLADSSLAPSPLGEMVRRRFDWAAALLTTLKSVVDWLFPGALWTWEALIQFFSLLMLAAFAAYALACWRLSTTSGESLSLRWILLPLLPIQLTLLLTPATLTTDIFNYAIYGQMPALYGANPYTHTPAEFPQSTLYYLIPEYWHDAPSVYGPSWVLISVGVAAAFQGRPLIDELLMYRLIANLAHFANVALVAWIATRLRRGSGPAAAAAYGWNPAALLEFSLNGHNDVLMLTPLLGSVALGMTQRPRLAALSLGFSIAQKYTSVLAAPVVLPWLAVGGGASPRAPALPRLWRERSLARRAATLGLLSAAVTAVTYGPFLTGGWDTFRQVAYWVTGPRLQNYWPEPLLIAVTAWIAGPLNLSWEAVWEPVLAAAKWGGRLALLALIVWEAARARGAPDVLAASARIWIVFLLLVNTWIMPWYYLWPLALAAPLGWTAILTRVCAGLTLMVTLVMYGKQMNYAVVQELAGLTVALPILLAGGAWLVRRRVAAPRAGSRDGSGANPALP